MYVKGATESKEDRAKNISEDLKAELLSTIENLFKKFDVENVGYLTAKDVSS
jgi:hypothetical protein